MPSLRIIFLLCISVLFLWTSFAQFSAEDFISQFQTQQSKLPSAEKKAYYLKTYNNLSLLASRNRNDAVQFTLYTTLKEYIKTQISLLWSGASSPVSSSVLSSSTSPSSSWMIIPKVDLVKVREVWLNLHNAERATKWLTAFTYSSALEWTATTWANHLATLGKATHLRNSGDGYYSYNSIKSWFGDQWIVFAGKEKNGQALFTENLWRWYYTCKKTDCTDDFIKAIKTSRTFFMNEKGKSYRPHYNAIVGNFSTLGLGVALVGKKYYLISHYTQVLK